MPDHRDAAGARCVRRSRAAGGRPGQSLPRSATETAETLYKTPALVAHRVRCGKLTCRCATGQGHGPYAFLYWREGGVQRRRYVPAAEVETVRAVIAGRRAAEQMERRAVAQSLDAWRGMRQWVRDLKTSGRR